MKKRTAIFALLLVSCLILTSCGLNQLLFGKPYNPVQAKKAYDDIEIPEIEMEDAEEYFEENGEVISSSDVKKSDLMLTEAGVYQDLASRGLAEYGITTSLDAEGNTMNEKEISPNSRDKHPIYETTYISPNGSVWYLMVIGDCIIANPVSYNFQRTGGLAVYVCESDTVVSFDNASKKFFVTIPSETVLTLKRVGRIDAATLDSLAEEELKA